MAIRFLTALLLKTLLSFLPHCIRTTCAIHRAEEIVEYTSVTAERYGVPVVLLLVIAQQESMFACDARSGGSLGSPRDRFHRDQASATAQRNSDTNGSALFLAARQSRTWEHLPLMSHFRCGRCGGCPPLIGYEPGDAVQLAARVQRVAGVPDEASFIAVINEGDSDHHE